MVDASSAWENEGQQQRESDGRRGGEAARWVKVTSSRTVKIRSKEGNTARYVHALAHRVGSVNVQAQTSDSCDAPMWNFHFKAACHLNGKIVVTICITGFNTYTLTWRGPRSQVFFFTWSFFFWWSQFNFPSYSLSVFLLHSNYTTRQLAFIDVMQIQRDLSETYQQDKETH